MVFFKKQKPTRIVPKISNLQHVHDVVAQRDSKISYTAMPVKPDDNGNSPSATMEIKFNPRIVCPGFVGGQGSPATAIEIRYVIKSGIQEGYHQNPSMAYDGTRRVAYFPNTPQGRCLLNRFKYAFSKGHMFHIARSLTSNRDNQTCWTTIPNKTSLQGGEFGFPDKQYLESAHSALDQIGIPDSDDCLNANYSQTVNGGNGSSNSSNLTSNNNNVTHTSNDNFSFPVHGKTIRYQAPTSLSLSDADIDSALEPYVSKNSILPAPIPPPPKASSVAASHPNVKPPPFASSSAPAVFQNPPSNLAPTPMITASVLIASGYSPPSVAGASVSTATAHHHDEPDCPICLDSLSSSQQQQQQQQQHSCTTSFPCVQLKGCQHAFHNECIVDCLKQTPNCPVCRNTINGSPQGKSPSGTMTVHVDHSRDCPGFVDTTNPGSPTGVITIRYEIPHGIQAGYHENPGVSYDKTSREAYLPNTLEGRQLLYRLVYAWKRGLIFRIGTSLTTHRPNQVTWTSIHHKTSLHGGAHGFPDNNYVPNCNSSLDALHVPDANGCILQKLND